MLLGMATWVPIGEVIEQVMDRLSKAQLREAPPKSWRTSDASMNGANDNEPDRRADPSRAERRQGKEGHFPWRLAQPCRRPLG